MKTGNTALHQNDAVVATPASMEPGHEDREYGQGDLTGRRPRRASMEPGHEDREYRPYTYDTDRLIGGLNGARS